MDVGGKTLAVEISGTGDPIVFLHGLGSTSSVWEPQVRRLSDGFRTVRYDLEGAGRSPLSGPLSIDGWVSDLAALCDRLELPSARFIGHSLGTLILQHFAVRHPDRVASLVLVGVNRAPTDARRGAVRERVAKVRASGIEPISAGIIKGGLSPATLANKPEVVGFVRELLLRQDQAGYAASCEAMAEAEAADIARVTCPTLVVAGEDDTISPPPYGAAFATELPDGQFRSIEACGHWHPIEQPAALSGLIADFM